MTKSLLRRQGIALILTILIITLVLFLSLYILSSSLTESRIAKNQTQSTNAYYLAEAGIQEMIWKLKNDPSYRDNFQTFSSWAAWFTRNNPFGPNSGSYTVSIVNDGIAHGEITASSSIAIGNNKYSQRVIKTKVYRLIGLSGMGTNAVINGNGTINFLNSERTEIFGDIYSNSAIVMQGNHPGVGVLAGNLTTAKNIAKGNGDLSVSGVIQDENSSPAPAPIVLPGVDFASLNSQASIVLPTDAALDAISTINGIAWVNVAADIEHDMTINGLLVVNGNLTITNSANIIINHTNGQPSGLIVNGNILIEKNPNYNGVIIINGIVYATGSVTLNKLNSGYTFSIIGGLTSGNGILIKNCSRTITIVYNNAILTDSLIPSSDSPVIVIEHWEEEY